MQPSEEEIRELLANVCRHSVMTDGEWRATVAHAIAEKTAEGVVWQMDMVVQEDFQRPQNSSAEEDFYYSVVGPYGEIMLGTNLPLYDGQLVTVTVRTREESDGQEVG